jgi:hypothetical protein
MKNKSKKVLIPFIIGCIIFFLSYGSYHFFFKEVLFYRPFSIEFKGIGSKDLAEINCIGYSPFNKKQYFYKDTTRLSISSDYYCHCKEITVDLPQTVFDKISRVVFSSGETRIVFLKENSHNFKIFSNFKFYPQKHVFIRISHFISLDRNFWGLYASAFLWGGTIRIIYIVVCVIFVLVSFLLLYRYKKPALLKLTNLIYRYLFILTPSLTHRQRRTIFLTLLIVILLQVFMKTTF